MSTSFNPPSLYPAINVLWDILTPFPSYKKFEVSRLSSDRTHTGRSGVPNTYTHLDNNRELTTITLPFNFNFLCFHAFQVCFILFITPVQVTSLASFSFGPMFTPKTRSLKCPNSTGSPSSPGDFPLLKPCKQFESSKRLKSWVKKGLSVMVSSREFKMLSLVFSSISFLLYSSP